MNPEPRSVVISTDAKYALPAAVALRSAYLNINSDTAQTQALVIDCGVDQSAKNRFAAAWPGQLRVVPLDPSHVVGFAGHPAGRMAYLALDQYVQQDDGRVLYLDSDTLVRASLEPLFDSNLFGCTMGAVPAISRPVMGADTDEPWDESVYAAGGAAPGGLIFNSGVLLVDVARWRNKEVFQRVLELARRFPDSDQRLLNAVMSSDWFPLPATWNTKRIDAAIYHFAALPRPWQSTYYRNSIWLEYLAVAESLGWHIPRPSFVATRVSARKFARRLRRRLAGTTSTR